ncbi:MAG: NAD-dependent epimerase [Prolixibacteraceae bacterium]|nr:NAD-dependent epimerase [Prolixibacteraceae bacterium]
MKILITGTAGFIGYHLAIKMAELGNEVIGIDNINDYYDVNLKYARLEDAGILRQEIDTESQKLVQSNVFKNYQFAPVDITNYQELNKLFETQKFDMVCNLAAQAGVRYSLENPHAYVQSNLVGFVNILELCRHNKIKHLVYASSSSVYGNSDKMPLSVDDRVDNPVSLYAASKKSNELMAHTYSHLYQLPTTGLRFFTVYGPWGRPDMAPIIFAHAITNNKPINVFNNGNLERDFTYIDDIIEGVVRVLNSESMLKPGSTIPYEICNIGNGSPVKLMDFIETMENAIGKKAVKEFLPMQAGDVYKTFADVSHLKQKYGYAPSTPLKEGITKFIEWYKVYYS